MTKCLDNRIYNIFFCVSSKKGKQQSDFHTIHIEFAPLVGVYPVYDCLSSLESKSKCARAQKHRTPQRHVHLRQCAHNFAALDRALRSGLQTTLLQETRAQRRPHHLGGIFIRYFVVGHQLFRHCQI